MKPDSRLDRLAPLAGSRLEDAGVLVPCGQPLWYHPVIAELVELLLRSGVEVPEDKRLPMALLLGIHARFQETGRHVYQLPAETVEFLLGFDPLYPDPGEVSDAPLACIVRLEAPRALSGSALGVLRGWYVYRDPGGRKEGVLFPPNLSVVAFGEEGGSLSVQGSYYADQGTRFLGMDEPSEQERLLANVMYALTYTQVHELQTVPGTSAGAVRPGLRRLTLSPSGRAAFQQQQQRQAGKGERGAYGPRLQATAQHTVKEHMHGHWTYGGEGEIVPGKTRQGKHGIQVLVRTKRKQHTRGDGAPKDKMTRILTPKEKA